MKAAAGGDFSGLRALAQGAGVDEFYTGKYIDTMKAAAGTGPDETFEKSHAYYLAVIQGFFLPYFYTRGTAFSFLMAQAPQMGEYATSWREIKPDFIGCHVQDRLEENYSGGVYIAPEQAARLLADCGAGRAVSKTVNDFFGQNAPVFSKALRYACGHGLGLIEASEVVEPNPTDLAKTVSYSNLMNCDKDGAYIYRDTALRQIEEYLRAQDDKSSPEEVLNGADYKKVSKTGKEDGGFFRRLFKK